MTSHSFALRAALPAGSLMLVLCACSPKEAPPKTESEPAAHAIAVERDTNGAVVVQLSAAARQAGGLEVGPVAPARVEAEIKAWGRALDPAPLAVLAAEREAATVAAGASAAEQKRLQSLASQNNASERALETAQAAAARDAAELDSVRLRLLAAWGREIAERPDLLALARSVASGQAALVQLDLAPNSAVPERLQAVRLLPGGEEGKGAAAEFLGRSPTVDPQVQGRGLLFLVKTNTAGLAAGRSVTGYISVPGQSRSGFTVPAGAVVRHQGGAWVYVEAGENRFRRTAVELGQMLDNGWFVASGLRETDKVVVTGAQQLLSEEMKGQGGD